MPQVKSAKSLYDTCLVFISKNMDKFCTESNVDGQADGVDAMNFGTNPFDQLHSDLLEALIKLITKDKYGVNAKETKQYLPQLITPNLLSLNLPGSPIGKEINLHYIIRLATIKCKHLKTLRLGSYTQNYPDCFNFIPKFSNLQILDVSQYESASNISGDDLFHLLGIHCTKLRELYASYNKISDSGIQGLCVIGNCKSIRVLDLMCSPALTSKGIQMSVDNLPSLKLLCHRSLLDNLACIAQSALDEKKTNLPKYSLSGLCLLSSIYRDGSLEKSILLCPYVTEMMISVNGKGLKNSELLSLLSLKKLYVLEIMLNFELPRESDDPFRLDGNLTFHGGVLPLLKRFGNSLKKLKLDGYFHDIDVSAVIEFCPNLYSLILCKSYELAWVEEVDWKLLKMGRVPSSTVSVLKNLEKLVLRGVFSFNPFVSSENLLKLLSSPLLKYVELNQIYDTLTDKILERTNNLHSFRYLESLTICYCNSVTKKGIDVFMQENNPLQVIYVFDCDKITAEDAIEWKEKEIWKKKNWRLQFCFS